MRPQITAGLQANYQEDVSAKPIIIRRNPLHSQRIRTQNAADCDNCAMQTPVAPEGESGSESLIKYPCLFPIKVMGNHVDGLVQAITVIAKAFDPSFDASTIELRESKGGKYLGVTIHITATSREQLDEVYRTLSTHPWVKVVL
mgnify:FL=1